MTEPATNSITPQSITAEGLEGFFDSTLDQPRTTPQSSPDQPWTKPQFTPDQGWTLTEAAETYNVTERTIRRWIKEQAVTAWKVNGPRGPEWRINPGSTVDEIADQGGSTVDSEPVIVSDTKQAPDNDRVWQLVQEQALKIEALTMRNGYLQAMLETKDEQIKLLTDSQHKASWWGRLRTWASRV
jgi:excisionase family DNA binding protein